MAKRTIFKKQKKARITRSEEYLVNMKYLGPEPVQDGHLLEDGELSKMYTWYSYMCTAADAREYIVDYLNANEMTDLAHECKSIPDGRVPVTAGWIARILSRGGNVPDRSREFLLSRIEKAVMSRDQEDDTKPKKQEKAPRQPVDVQANIREKARDIIGQIEAMLDRDIEFSMYEYMQKNSIPPVYASFIYEYYIKMVGELEEVLEGKDPQLKEAYRGMNKARIQRMYDMYCGIVEDALRFSDNVKRTRKANRKPRKVSVEKLISKFKFKKNDQEFKLVSIDPQSILASQELWVFNTKYRTLTVFRAQDAGGLGIKTVNITGFNTTTSITKRLRKPEETLQKVLTGGKVVLRELMDNLSTKDTPAKSRISEDMILLKVVK